MTQKKSRVGIISGESSFEAVDFELSLCIKADCMCVCECVCVRCLFTFNPVSVSKPLILEGKPQKAKVGEITANRWVGVSKLPELNSKNTPWITEKD